MMLGKKTLIRLSVFSALVLAASLQAATISSDESVEILAVDGQVIKTGHDVHDKHIHVNAGQHQIVVRYYGHVKKEGKSTIYSTPPYIFSVNLKSNDEISVLVPRFSTYAQAQAYFRRGPDWKIHYQNGRVKVVQYDQLMAKELVSSDNIEDVVVRYNQQRGKQLTPSQKNIAPHKSAVTQTQPSDTLIQTIQLLYNNATAAQKKAIKQWIVRQP